MLSTETTELPSYALAACSELMEAEDDLAIAREANAPAEVIHQYRLAVRRARYSFRVACDVAVNG